MFVGLLVILWTWVHIPQRYINRSQLENGLFGPAGDFLEVHASKGSTAMLEPIGLIGWEARNLRIIDEIGLVSPEVATLRRLGPGWYADILSRELPDWLVVRRSLLRSGTAFAGRGSPFRSDEERQRAFAPYELVAVGDTASGDQSIFILHRDR